MTFPMFQHQSNDSILAQMFSKPKEIEALRGSRPSSQNDAFWTDTLVRNFLRMQGRRPNMAYDDLYQDGREEESHLREGIKEKYDKIFQMRKSGRNNMIDEIKMSI